MINRLQFFSLALLIVFNPSHGEKKTSEITLRPYKAFYQSEIKGMDVLFERKLSISENDKILLTMIGQKFIFRVSETSLFKLNGASIIPIEYEYTFFGGITRHKKIKFDTISRFIKSFDKGEWYDLPKESNILDRLNVQEQLRIILMEQKNYPLRVSFRIADGSRIKNYNFKNLGEQILQTNIGEKKTIRFAREFEKNHRRDEVWLAPDLDFLMVKHVHQEKGTSTEAVLLEVAMEENSQKQSITDFD